MAASGQEGTSAALAQKARETWRTLGVLCTQPFTPTQKSEQPLTGHPRAWKPDLREMIPTQEKPLGLASLLSPDVTCPLNPLSFTSEVDTPQHHLYLPSPDSRRKARPANHRPPDAPYRVAGPCLQVPGFARPRCIQPSWILGRKIREVILLTHTVPPSQ